TSQRNEKAMLKTIIAIRHKNSFNPQLCNSKRTLEVTPSSAINSIRQTKKYHPHYILADMSIRHRTS
ncbi:hypothetical protein, partial [Methanobrevibacter sp. UBA417]|uniref:hypothetical protein n=1 Tax=Methanobrevibacter sp. UBA417 TaxID=1915487 RepID=UPI0039B9CCB7